jgi:hypothetical protein
VHRVGEVAVAGEPVGDDQVALPERRVTGARPAQYCREFGVVNCSMCSPISGDPGGETATEAGKAQVDLAARKPLPRSVLVRASRGAQQ